MIQHEDRNIGPADYKNLSPMQLRVTSIFYTIQGEGPFGGFPAIFIRLAGCNRGLKSTMGCPWCDTAFQFDKGTVMTFNEIAARMIEVTSMVDRDTTNLPCVVLTGGEPMLQKNIVPFMEGLFKTGFTRVQIESNGDFLAEGYTESEICTNHVALVVSPKVTGSKYHKPKREVMMLADAIKFLISADENSPYHSVPDCWLPKADAEPGGIYLSPITVYKRPLMVGETASIFDMTLIDLRMTLANYQRAAELAMYHGYIISLQKHLFLGLP